MQSVDFVIFGETSSKKGGGAKLCTSPLKYEPSGYSQHIVDVAVLRVLLLSYILGLNATVRTLEYCFPSEVLKVGFMLGKCWNTELLLLGNFFLEEADPAEAFSILSTSSTNSDKIKLVHGEVSNYLARAEDSAASQTSA